MNIKYNKKQTELREDPVVDGLLKSKEFVTKNSMSITVIAVATVVFLGVFLGFSYFKNSRQKNASEAFGKAMVAYSEKNSENALNQFKMVAENYRGSVSGTMAAHMLAGILYTQGRYDEAIEWYNIVRKSNNADFLGAQSYEGLAACYEAKSDIGNAISNLEKALNDDRISFRHVSIKWKLALLTKDSDTARAIKLCDEIITDTLAQHLGSEAKYLKTMLEK